MPRQSRSRLFIAPLMTVGVSASMLLAAGAAEAQTAAPGYKLGVFAGPLAGSSAPDSIAVVGSDVFISYGNGGAPDGSGGAVSTIAEYNLGGSLLGQISVTGHNDGLRYDGATGQLWALQNEDGNATIAFLNPAHLTAPTTYLTYSAAAHGGGFDDVAFGANGTYISASNPQLNPNTAPAIVAATISGKTVNVSGALSGDATATVINGGGTTKLNLQDPDSLIFSPTGQLVLDSQSDQQLVFVSNVGKPSQSVSVLNLWSANGCVAVTGNCTVDDTVFGNGGRERLLVADTKAGIVYSLTGNFASGGLYSAADTFGQVVNVNASTGVFTPLVTGLMSPHGEAFTAAIPEPSTWAMMLVGFAGLAFAGYRAARRDAAVA